MAHKTWLIFYELIKNFGLGYQIIKTAQEEPETINKVR